MIVEVRDEVITLSGQLSKNQWSTLESAIALRLRYHPAGVVVDLGGLTQVTAEGTQTFREAAAYIARVAPGARLVLAAAPSNIQRALRQSGGTGSSLVLAGTVAEARASLAASQSVMGTSSVEANVSRNGRTATDADAHPVVLVGLLGSAADEHAAAVACRLAANIPSDKATGEPAARMHLAHLLTVPRDRSLLAPLGAEEEAAAKRLRQFAAAVKASGCVGSVVTQIERTRDGGIRLVELASDLRAVFLILAVGANASAEEIVMVRYVVEKAPCEVVVNRVPTASLRAENEAPVNE